MTREQFVTRWHAHVYGKFLLGTTEYRVTLKQALTVGGVDSDEAVGRVTKKLGTETETLLGQLYDSLQPAAPKPATNGHANGNGVHKPAVKVATN